VTENPLAKEGVVEAHRKRLWTVRRAEEVATVVFWRWGRLQPSKAAVEAPAAPEGRGEGEAWAIQGREGDTDGAHRRGRLAVALHVIPAWRWLYGDPRRMRCKGEHGGVVWMFGGGEKAARRKTWLGGGRHFLKEVAG
jgi:hypothetical protein